MTTLNARHNGGFITLEGSEGAGKSSNLEVVVKLLEARGHTVVSTREPGGTQRGEAIRKLLLRADREPLDSHAELLLMFAARAQHLAVKIRPALAAGHWVVCDRFTDATYAYQGGGRGIPHRLIADLESLVHPDLQPDLTVYLDLPVEAAFARIAGRRLDRIEREQRDFFERVRTVYLERAGQHERFRVVDASASLKKVRAQVELTVQEFLESRT